MIIGIIAAIKQEISLLYNHLIHPCCHQIAGLEIYSGNLNKIKTVLVTSGIGKVSAALSTTLLLNNFKPNFVINTGSAGSLIPSLKIGDIVVPYSVGYHDVDITSFKHKFGQVVGYPSLFKADSYLVSLAEEIINRLDIHALHGLVVSGDSFINGGEALIRIRKNFPQAIAVEMEATAVAHVCHCFKTPFIVIRSISDCANKVAHLSFKESITTVTRHSSFLVEEMVKELACH